MPHHKTQGLYRKFSVSDEEEFRRRGKGQAWGEGLLLVDDNSDFCELVAASAADLDIPIRTALSVSELCISKPMRQVADYDLLILDYYLHKHWTGLDVAGFRDSVFKGIPIMMVSSEASLANNLNALWERGVMSFVTKAMGARAILEEALLILGMSRYYGTLGKPSSVERRSMLRAFDQR